jgi:peptidylprolyl isomerase
VIGQAPRQLDRNIALVGRVIDGIENLSALPRGTEALGFYKDKAEYVPIRSVTLASEMNESARPSYEVMDTASKSFAEYLHLRANRHDDFYIRPAGGVDLCNVQVPVRKKVA